LRIYYAINFGGSRRNDRIYDGEDSNVVLSSVGQSFTLNSNATLGYVKFVTYRGGLNNNPVGYLIARLYRGIVSGSGVIPLDDPANSGILAKSDSVDMEELTGVTWDTFTFSGAQQYNLILGLKYIIQVAVLSATVLDASNNVWVRGPSVNCVTGVESVYYSSAWHTYANYDVCIQVFDTEDNLLYECPLSGCAAYGHDILDTVHPEISVINIPRLQRYGAHGWNGSAEEFKRVKVTELGVLDTS